MSNYPKSLQNHKSSLIIYYALGCLLLIGMSVAFWCKEYILSIVPLVGFLALVFAIRPVALFYMLVLVMPISMEYEFGGLGLDLPSEPLLIGMALLSTFWFLSNNKKAFRLLTHPLTFTVFAHLMWVYCCIISSSNTLVSLKYALSKSWYIIGSLVGAYWIVYNPERLYSVLWCLIAMTFATIFVINIEHGLEGFTFDSIGAACNPLYRNHVIYGVFLVMVLPFLFVMRKQTRPKSLHRLVVDVILFSFFWSIYFSYTRGAWLALPVMLFVWFCVRYKLLRILYPLGVVAGVMFFIYMADDYRYLQYAPEYENTIYHDELTDHLSATFEGKDMSTMERFHRWIAAFRIFSENPIMGVGPNTFVDVYKPYTSTSFETYISENEERSTVHNYFIYVLAEQGIIGLLVIVLMVGTFFIYGERTFHLIKDPTYKYLYLACILAGASFWLNSLFSDLLEANKVAPMFFFCIAWMIRLEYWDKKTANA